MSAFCSGRYIVNYIMFSSKRIVGVSFILSITFMLFMKQRFKILHPLVAWSIAASMNIILESSSNDFYLVLFMQFYPRKDVPFRSFNICEVEVTQEQYTDVLVHICQNFFLCERQPSNLI